MTEVLGGQRVAWLDQRAPSVDPRQDLLDRWGAALAHGDVDEVDRLVHQSHADWDEVATAGLLGTMLGLVVPSTPNGLVA